MIARLIAATVLAGPAPAGEAGWGSLPDGREVHRYVLENASGMRVTLIDLGAALMRVELAGDTVTVAPPDFAAFAGSQRRYGAVVGRYAGRLPGAITIGGRRYPLATNAAGVTLHGGDPGFDHALWTARRIGPRAVEFRYLSRDGEQGFPGTLIATATYMLARDRDALTLTLTARSDRPTAANLTSHVYFNLSGAATVGCHRLRVPARRYVALDRRKLPTGPASVAGTQLDFRTSRPLAPVLADGGTDALLVLDRPTLRLSDPASGRRLSVTTDAPAVQVFTGNSFDGRERNVRSRPIGRFGGIALEPQRYLAGTREPGPGEGLVTPARPARTVVTWAFDRIPKGACA